MNKMTVVQGWLGGRMVEFQPSPLTAAGEGGGAGGVAVVVAHSGGNGSGGSPSPLKDDAAASATGGTHMTTTMGHGSTVSHASAAKPAATAAESAGTHHKIMTPSIVSGGGSQCVPHLVIRRASLRRTARIITARVVRWPRNPSVTFSSLSAAPAVG
jgi:hypothetical protein